MKEDIITIGYSDFLGMADTYLSLAHTGMRIIIDMGDEVFVLARAKVGKVIIPDQEAEDAIRDYFLSRTAERQAVDLGLSVKWAAGNLFSIKETDSGGFYYAGETDPVHSGKG